MKNKIISAKKGLVEKFYGAVSKTAGSTAAFIIAAEAENIMKLKKTARCMLDYLKK